MGFSFAYNNFACYCIVLLKLQWAIEIKKKKKKRVCDGLLYPENLDPSSLSPGRPVVLLVCGFRGRDNLLAWRKLFANFCELRSRIWFWEEYNRFEQIYGVYEFDRFSSKHLRNNDKWKCREILIIEIFVPWRPFTQHDSHIFSYSNFKCQYIQDQSEYRKSLTHFWWLMPCEWDCTAILLVLKHPIPNKFNRRTYGRFTPYRLLTLPKKILLNYIFIVSCSY